MNQLSRGRIIHLVCLLYFLINICECQNIENKLKDVLRNNTKLRDNQNNSKNGDQNDDGNQNDNPLKSEAEKYLKQCGVERDSKNNANDNYNNYRNGNNGNGNNRNGQGSGSSRNNDYSGSSRKNNNRNSNSNYNRFSQGDYDNEGSNSNNDDGEWNSYSSQNWKDSQNRGTNNNGYKNNRQSDYSNYGQDNTDGTKYGNGGNTGNENGYSNSNQYGSNLGNRNGDDRTNFGYRTSFNQDNQGDSGRGSNNNQQGYGFMPPNRGYQSSSTNIYDIRSSYNPNNPNGPNRGYNRDAPPNEDCNDNRDRDRGYGTHMFGYNTGMTLGLKTPQHRQKRFNYFNRDENSDNENTQCVSQCVFGYLQILDDDRSPSETMLIKWLQEHVTGNDMDRVKALRDARRCFARLTTDTDDGCDFSKELSNCLDLDLE